MSLSIPTKMSLFENVTSLSTASYIIGLDVYGGALSNIKISGSAAGYELARKRWIIDPPVTSTSDSRGDDGAESYSDDGKYWIKSGSVWIEISGGGGAGGTAGSSGTSGQNGQNGSSGTSGQSGQGGSSGTSGQTGQNGSSGTSGQSGQTGPTIGAIYSRLMKNISGTISNYSSETKWANADVFNVKDFGAVGNGSTDDTTAVNNAISAALNSSYGGCIYFPAGIYKITSVLSFQTCAKSIQFLGDGQSSVIIATDGASSYSGNYLFDLKSTTNYVSFHFRNLQLKKDVSGDSGSTTVSAIKIYCAPALTSHRDNLLLMDSVVIQSSGNNQGSWAGGVTMAYASNAVFNNCTFAGKNNATGKGIEFATAVSVNTIITNTNLNFWQYGIYSSIYQEGLLVSNSLIVDANVGIYIAVASNVLRCTLVACSNVHIDARGPNSKCVYLGNVDGAFFSNCYFTIGADGTAGDTCIVAQQVAGMQVASSKFNINGDYGITLKNSNPSVNDCNGNPIGCIGVQIIGNCFEGGPTNTVYLENLSMSCIVQNNIRLQRDASCGTNRVDMTVYSFNANDTTSGTRGNVVQT